MSTTLALLAMTWAGGLEAADTSRDLDAVYQPRRVALLIGVDRYEDPALTPLRFAAKDARDLGAVLDDADYGDFDKVMTITAQTATTREGIEKALRFATADLQRDDTFVLYMSGHGTLTLDAVDGTQLWFLPSDGQLGQARETGIDVAWLEDQVAEVDARRRVLIMDTCHNGREGSRSQLSTDVAQRLDGLRGEAPAPRSVREVSESEARLFAAEYYQPAMEAPELSNGVYTHFLIESISDGAREADLDGDGLVDVTEAHDWARDKTMTYTGGLQTPRAEYRIVGREDIYLAGNQATRTAAEKALITATDSLLASAHVLVDGQPRGVLPELVAIEPGAHTIEIRDAQGRTLAKRVKHVRAGETLMVEDLMPDTRPSVEALGGALLRHGPGVDAWHPGAAEIELRMRRPDMGPRWLEPDLHARLNGWTGEVAAESVPVSAGGFSLGAGVSARSQRLPVTLGPAVDGLAQWRRFEDFDSSGQLVQHAQLRPTVALGGTTALRVPVGDRYLVARYDLRWVPYSYGDQDTSYLQHGLAIGLGTHL
jgi:uncharacterized caspase-like protein